MHDDHAGRRVAIVGGSFNPPHVAHQMVVLWLLSTGKADAVWLVPCYQHPFGKSLESFEHRCRMCELAAEIFPRGRVAVSRVEADIGGESRTLNTLQHLRRQRPELQLLLVIGADILEEKNSWYGFDQIERLVQVVTIGRQGYDCPANTVALPAVSSTMVRASLARGEPVDAYLPRAVRRYIDEHGLYR